MDLWLSLRQPYDQFWKLSPREILRICDGLNSAQERDQEERLAMNHHLAGLVSYAFNDPKKMPKYEPAKKDSSERRAEIEEIEVRAALQAMSGKGGDAD